jgi:PKD repeat protein
VSLGVTVTPDVVTQDGVSEATVSVLALDASSRPISGLSLRLEISIAGFAVDFGTLATRTLFTDSNGRASTRYTAPAAPPAASGAGDVLVTFRVTPIGNDYSNANPRTVDLLVSPPGVRLGPNSMPLPAFSFSPTAPRANDSVFFDGSASKDDGQIVSYNWSFGDGSTGSGQKPSHAYAVAGVYNVILTVTDDRGLSASTAPVEVTVGASTLPVSSFVFSPTDPTVNVTTVHFNATASTAAAGRSIVSYEWDFGDGSFGDGAVASHIYATAGTFTVTLVVRDNTGQQHSSSKTVTVKP